MKIDYKKCIGCRQGLALFSKGKGGFQHFDLFASNSDILYNCPNSNVIEPYIKQIPRSLYYEIVGDMAKVQRNQAFWWEDITDIMESIYRDSSADEYNHFFMGGTIGERLIDQSNLEIERVVLEAANKHNIEIVFEGNYGYEYLLKWKYNE